MLSAHWRTRRTIEVLTSRFASIERRARPVAFEMRRKMTMFNSPLAALVDPRHAAVLVVDVQPLFTEGNEMPLDQMFSALRRLLDAARAADVLRVFIRFVRAEPPDERWATHWTEQLGAEFVAVVAPDSPEVVFSPGFEPGPGDLVVAKDCYSAFVGTDLADQLRSRGIETVLVSGLTTDVCVSSTARDAFQAGFRAITLSDCCAARFPAWHEAALETLGRVFGRVCTSDEVIATWQTVAVAAKAEEELRRS
jgi:nicotinamidase-related amidase